ncbi:MAG: SDR family oxidoreductase [Kiritimatiellia bacterium]
MGGSVLVTGGARRIGRAICATLRARGWNVLVHARQAGAPLGVDFAEPGAARRLFDAACRLAPDLAAIVNNAAVFSAAGALPPEAERRLRRVNLGVPAALTALLAGRLRAQGRTGAVVDLLDARIFRRGLPATPYSRSKRDLWKRLKAAAKAEAPVLRVNGVAPGPVLPPSAPGEGEKGGPILLAGRPTPEDVAGAVAFLLEAPACTGQVICVDAGQALL